MLCLRDRLLSFLASLGRLVLSVQGFLLRFTNFLRVYRAAPCLHRGPTVALHCRHRTTTRLHPGALHHRRWAALGLLTTTTLALAVMVLRLQGGSSQSQNDNKRNGQYPT